MNVFEHETTKFHMFFIFTISIFFYYENVLHEKLLNKSYMDYLGITFKFIQRI